MGAPLLVGRFGGLRLDVPPDEVGPAGAIDMLNVDLDAGSIRTRPGYDTFTDSAAAAPYDRLHVYETSGGSLQVLANRSGAIDAMGDDGIVTDTESLAGAGASMVNFGTPTAQYAYIARLTGTVRRWDGSAFSSPAGMPTALNLAVQSPDNRLVAGGISGNLNRVQFSDAGDPETWTSTSWVELTPGDGETITGMAAWRDRLFVFKESKFFVFTGNSTGPTGEPEFNYYPVDTGYGLSWHNCFTVAPEGVYFAHTSGIYLTTGDAPVEVSKSIRPVFWGPEPVVFAELGTAGQPHPTMGYWNRRLHFGYSTTGSRNTHTLIFDPEYDQWKLYDFPAGAFAVAHETESKTVLLFSDDSNSSNHIREFDPSEENTDDRGTAIASSYRSGLYNPAADGRETRVRRTRLWGSGTLTWKTSRNWGDLSTGQSVTLGTAPDVDDALVGCESRAGHLMSHEVSATSGRWTLHSLTHEIVSAREPGVQSA